MRSIKHITLLLLALLCCLAVALGEAPQGEAILPGEGIQTYAWETPEGDNMLSVRRETVTPLLFGREERRTEAAVIDQRTGEEAPLERLFVDVDAAQAFLDDYVQEQVLPHISSYLDRSDVLPVPLDSVYFDADGVTVHYSSDAFSYFTGEGGAIELKYYEIAALLTPLGLAAQGDAMAAALGRAQPGDNLRDALARLGETSEPDYITGGEIYETRNAATRGAYLIAPRGAQEDESAAIAAIRLTRFDLGGLLPGLSAQTECEAALGKPDESGYMDADAASGLRLQTGAWSRYTAHDAAKGLPLTLYFDEADTLYAIEIGQR